MTANELLRFQLEDATHQLRACLETLSEDQLDVKPTPQGMSVRSIAEHLCECYEAFLASVEGRTHEWGNYALADKSKDNLLKVLEETRARAVEAAVSSTDDETLRHAHLYIVAHDNYHVGQLCLVHLAINPDWDPYSIYNNTV